LDVWKLKNVMHMKAGDFIVWILFSFLC